MSKRFQIMAAGLAAACFLTSMSGCAAANRTPQGTTPNGTITRQGTNLSQELTRGAMPGTGLNNLMTNQGTTTSPGGINMLPLRFDTQKADNIMKNLGSVSGCKNPKAVVNGNTALVSYTPSGTAGNTPATKNAIMKKVKSLDRNIANVVVTESPDITGRMNQLMNDIKSNRAGANLNNTFNQLVQKVKTG